MVNFGKANISSFDKRLFTEHPPIVWYSILLINMAALFLGYDQVMFSALQATPSFLKDFGETSGSTQLLGAQQSSIMNSVPLVGKGLGCALAAPLNERYGYKVTMFAACFTQILGIILELATKNWGVFTTGRVFLYMAVGFAECVIPLYQAEIVLPQYRGLFNSTYTFVVAIGSLWASLAVRGVSTTPNSIGWITAVVQQFPPVIILVLGLYWIPPSPRWLIEKGRKEEGLVAFRRIRSKGEHQEAWIELEVAGIEESINYDKSFTTGSWISLFQGTNLRRTAITCMLFFGNNWTGNTFISIYATTLYIQLGLTAQAFNYGVIKASITIVAVFIGMAIVDKVGRRPILIIGCFFQAAFLFIMGGIGTQANPSPDSLRVMVAMVMLFKVAVVMSLQVLSPVITAEISGPLLRKKMFAVACVVDVITGWAVSYSSPYLISAQYANLGIKVGFIFAAVSALFVFLCYFFVPELSNRSLEEIDELFEAKLWAWQFASYKVENLGHKVSVHDEAALRRFEEQGQVSSPEKVQADEEIDEKGDVTGTHVAHV